MECVSFLKKKSKPVPSQLLIELIIERKLLHIKVKSKIILIMKELLYQVAH